MRLTDAGDRYRAWRCRLCDRVEEMHYDHEPAVRYAEPCPYCNDPDSPLPVCACGETLPSRGRRRCVKCARKARAEVFRARWLAAHPAPPTEPLFPVEHLEADRG